MELVVVTTVDGVVTALAELDVLLELDETTGTLLEEEMTGDE